MEVISKKDAVAKGSKKYFTGKPCIRGHLMYRYTYNGTCVGCMLERLKTLKSKDPKYWVEYDKEYGKKNRDKKSEQKRQWRKDNPERAKEYNSEWTKRTLPRRNALSNKRRADKIQATPFWADLVVIQALYDLSDRLSKETGIRHHVDHIIPLKHPLVCGLHVPANLRIITAEENLAKHNKFEIE